MSLRDPGQTSPMGQNFLACCYALIGLSAVGLAALRWTARRIDEATRLPAGRRSW